LIILVSALTVIGGLVVLVFFAGFVKELYRAIRNSHRVATVAVRTSQRRRRPNWREWWFAFKNDIFSTYTELRIGWIGIPHDHSAPLRNRLPRY